MLLIGFVVVASALVCPDGKAAVGENCYPEKCVFNGTVCSDKGDCIKSECHCDKGHALSEQGCQPKDCVNRGTKYYCGRHGVCSTDSPFTCTCEDGYTSLGHSCVPPECISNGTVCNGRGTCIYGPDEKPYCQCLETYAGELCEECSAKSTLIGSHCKPNECVSDIMGELTSCGGHGVCIPATKITKAFCLCLPGMKNIGNACVPKMCLTGEEGNYSVCTGHGTCKRKSCSCDEGYEGALCQYKTQHCEEGYVSKDGECVSELCISSSGEVCSGGGSCVKDHCVCDQGFALIGKTECTPLQCIVLGQVCPHGSCKNTDGTWACVCDRIYVSYNGYCIPKSCITSYSPIGAPVLCSDHGTCDYLTGICNCNYQYSGKHCDMCSSYSVATPTGECTPLTCVSGMHDTAPEICSNHGSCQRNKLLTDEYIDYCTCDDDYALLDTSKCVHENCLNPNTLMVECTNHGVCVDDKCVCDSGYVGPYCEDYSCPEGELYASTACYPEICVVEYSDGQRRVCGGHGHCAEGDNGFECKCNHNAVMLNGVCTATVCITNPDKGIVCSGNGICRDNLCLCDPGFRGGYCERPV